MVLPGKLAVKVPETPVVILLELLKRCKLKVGVASLNTVSILRNAVSIRNVGSNPIPAAVIEMNVVGKQTSVQLVVGTAIRGKDSGDSEEECSANDSFPPSARPHLV